MNEIKRRKKGKMNKLLFEFGAIVQTRGVYERRKKDPEFNEFVQKCLARHIKGDWGDLDRHDWGENELSLGERLRLFSMYKGNRKIYIITEADRSATCILFPDEY